MTPRLIVLAATPPQPWRNGGGVTRELLAWPAGGQWQVRVSVAEIETDGPFSPFPGIERWFAVLEGGGVLLTIAGAEHRCRAGDPPLSFSGDVPAGSLAWFEPAPSRLSFQPGSPSDQAASGWWLAAEAQEPKA
jgi:environmental stress-induced protein Ves